MIWGLTISYKDTMIRVAQILGKMNGGGAEQVVMNYYRAIDREQVQFDFYLFKGSKYVPVEEIKSLGGRLFVLPTLKHPIKYVRALSRLLSENNYRIMHCHLSTLSFLPLLAGKQAGIPVRILHNHSTSGGAREWLRNFAKMLFKPLAKIHATDYFACSQYASRWIYGSRATADLSEDDHPISKHRRVRIMPNAIDTRKYSFSAKNRAEIRKELHIPANAFVLGHIGRFCPQKNQGFLVDIFREVLRQDKNAVLVMVGDGPDKELVQARAIAGGVSSRVIFTGQRSDAEKLYSAFDCFLLPSNYEGLPVVGVEAQCAGLPCLFSNRVTPEVKLLGTSQLLALGSPHDWACAVLCCKNIRDKNAPAILSQKGFDIFAAADQLKNYYLKKSENF